MKAASSTESMYHGSYSGLSGLNKAERPSRGAVSTVIVIDDDDVVVDGDEYERDDDDLPDVCDLKSTKRMRVLR